MNSTQLPGPGEERTIKINRRIGDESNEDEKVCMLYLWTVIRALLT